MLMEDCILYRKKKTGHACEGLKEMLCKDRDDCPFYKSKFEYDEEGRPLMKESIFKQDKK